MYVILILISSRSLSYVALLNDISAFFSAADAHGGLGGGAGGSYPPP